MTVTASPATAARPPAVFVLDRARSLIAADPRAHALASQLDADERAALIAAAGAEVGDVGKIVTLGAKGSATGFEARVQSLPLPGGEGRCMLVWLLGACCECAVFRSLSVGELQAVHLAARGLSSARIGQQLSVAPVTVEGRIKRARAKLGARNRTQLAYLLGRASGCCGVLGLRLAHSAVGLEAQGGPE